MEDEDGVVMEQDDDHISGIVHGIGLEVYVKMDVQVLDMEIGGVNIQDVDQMIVGLHQIVMDVDIKYSIYI